MEFRSQSLTTRSQPHSLSAVRGAGSPPPSPLAAPADPAHALGAHDSQGPQPVAAAEGVAAISPETRRRCHGRALALAGALTTGLHNGVSQFVGWMGRAGLQTALLMWTARGVRMQEQRPAPAPIPPAAGSEDSDPGDGSSDGSEFSNGTVPTNGTTPRILSGDRTDLRNQTLADSRNDLAASADLIPIGASDLSEQARDFKAAEPAWASYSATNASVLAGLAATVNGLLAQLPSPSDLNLSSPEPLQPVVVSPHPALEIHDGCAGPWGAITLAGAIVGVSVLVASCRVGPLIGGAISAVTGERLDAYRALSSPRAAAVFGILGLATAAATAAAPLGGTSRDPDNWDGRVLLSAWLLFNAAGRTVQNVLRDVFTQSTRHRVHQLTYRVAPPGARAAAVSGQPAALAPATLGSEALQYLMRPGIVATRTTLTVASYWVGIYLCLRYVQPAIQRAMGVHGIDIEDQIRHGHTSLEVLLAQMPAALTSALIEGLDSLTASLSTSAAFMGMGDAQVQLARPAPSDTLAQDIEVHLSLRIVNAMITVEPERAGNLIAGIDRQSGVGLGLQTGALGMTDLRGPIAHAAQHYLRLRARRAREAGQPASQALQVIPLVSSQPQSQSGSGPQTPVPAHLPAPVVPSPAIQLQASPSHVAIEILPLNVVPRSPASPRISIPMTPGHYRVVKEAKYRG